jgi:hypothetical protein
MNRNPHSLYRPTSTTTTSTATTDINTINSFFATYNDNFREYQRNVTRILSLIERYHIHPSDYGRNNRTSATPSPRQTNSSPEARSPTASTTGGGIGFSGLNGFGGGGHRGGGWRFQQTHQPTQNRGGGDDTTNLAMLLYPFLSGRVPSAILDFEFNQFVNNHSSPQNLPTREQIEAALENVTYSDDLETLTCPISWDAFTESTPICRIRNCQHLFNRENLMRWFERNSYCPVCRYDIRNTTETRNTGRQPPNNSEYTTQQNSSNEDSASGSGSRSTLSENGQQQLNGESFINPRLNHYRFSYDLLPNYHTNDVSFSSLSDISSMIGQILTDILDLSSTNITTTLPAATVTLAVHEEEDDDEEDHVEAVGYADL